MTTKLIDEKVPRSRTDLVTFGSERIGVTNGLLKFPQLHTIDDISLVPDHLDRRIRTVSENATVLNLTSADRERK